MSKRKASPRQRKGFAAVTAAGAKKLRLARAKAERRIRAAKAQRARWARADAERRARWERQDKARARLDKARARKRRKQAIAAQRSEAGRKGHRTKLAKRNVVAVLATMVRLAAEGRGEEDWAETRGDWYESKRELFHAVDDDFDRYAEILDEIADDADVDWAISYGPEPEG